MSFTFLIGMWYMRLARCVKLSTSYISRQQDLMLADLSCGTYCACIKGWMPKYYLIYNNFYWFKCIFAINHIVWTLDTNALSYFIINLIYPCN